VPGRGYRLQPAVVCSTCLPRAEAGHARPKHDPAAGCRGCCSDTHDLSQGVVVSPPAECAAMVSRSLPETENPLTQLYRISDNEYRGISAIRPTTAPLE
jgi:hypothetical protein